MRMRVSQSCPTPDTFGDRPSLNCSGLNGLKIRRVTGRTVNFKDNGTTFHLVTGYASSGSDEEMSELHRPGGGSSPDVAIVSRNLRL